jgi:hypothetical protein
MNTSYQMNITSSCCCCSPLFDRVDGYAFVCAKTKDFDTVMDELGELHSGTTSHKHLLPSHNQSSNIFIRLWSQGEPEVRTH